MYFHTIESVLVTNMWNKYFWLIIAGSPPLYERDGEMQYIYIYIYIYIYCIPVSSLLLYLRNKQISQDFPLCLSLLLSLNRRPHIWKNRTSNYFLDTNFTKTVSVVHIFSLKIMNYLKKLIRIKSLNTKQCPSRLSLPPVNLSSFAGGKF